MGGVQSTEAKQRHIAAEKALRLAKAQLEKQKKILLLGSGDSGKSTVLKQMRLIHHLPFTSDEVEQYRQLVFQNITYDFLPLLQEMHSLAPGPEQASPYTERISQHVELVHKEYDLKDEEPFPIHYLQALKELWADPQVQAVWARGNEFALPENLGYYFSSLDRLFEPTYKPTELDILQSHSRTIGIAETRVPVSGYELLVVDVGGQRNERRKWIHCFEDVSAMLFLVNLSGYDQCITEDRSANQMTDAMQIWSSLSLSRWFRKTSFVLFLNKNDLFEAKVQRSKISKYFPDYRGPEKDAEAGRDYFLKRFTKLHNASKVKGRPLYSHITTATNTKMIRVVVSAVEESILRNNLERSGLVT